MPDAPRHPAVFMDRDGTLIVEREYLADPAGVEFVPGVFAALKSLHDAGYKLVLVTNQSGIARGLFTLAEYKRVQRRIEQELSKNGVKLDGVYFCPHHPDFSGRCECRKPALGLFREAAQNLSLDLPRSVFVGDRLHDVLPAGEWRARGILVRTGYGGMQSAVAPLWVEVADDLPAAARLILEKSRSTP